MDGEAATSDSTDIKQISTYQYHPFLPTLISILQYDTIHTHPPPSLHLLFNFSSPSIHPSINIQVTEFHILINQSMACSAVVPMAALSSHKVTPNTTSTSLFNPLTTRINTTRRGVVVSPKKSTTTSVVVVKSSLKENVGTAIAAAALTASMVVPEVAQAASGVSPSLNNFLLSIGAGGVVLGGILGAIIGVSNFDPVKRG